MKIKIHVHQNEIKVDLVGAICSLLLLAVGALTQQTVLVVVACIFIALPFMDILATVVYLSSPKFVHKPITANTFFGVGDSQLKPLAPEHSMRVVVMLLITAALGVAALLAGTMMGVNEVVLAGLSIPVIWYSLRHLWTDRTSWFGKTLMTMEQMQTNDAVEKLRCQWKYLYAGLFFDLALAFFFFFVFQSSTWQGINIAVGIIWVLLSAFDVFLLYLHSVEIKNAKKLAQENQEVNP